MLRVACDGDNASATVEINGKFRGECPLDLQVPVGTLQLLVRKKVDTERDRLFSQEVRMGEDSIKKIDVQLGPPQMTPQKFAALRKAADQRVPDAMYRLGALYLVGDSVPKDKAQAEAWIQKAAEGGNGKAMLYLATNSQDANQGCILYQKAADAGNAEGMFQRAYYYRKGLCGLQKSDQSAGLQDRKGIEVLSKSAETGDTEAMGTLADFYQFVGLDGKRDNDAAFRWRQRAAEAGDPVGMEKLARAYLEGTGVPKSKDLWLKWLRKSAANGSVSAKQTLETSGER